MEYVDVKKYIVNKMPIAKDCRKTSYSIDDYEVYEPIIDDNGNIGFPVYFIVKGNFIRICNNDEVYKIMSQWE